MLLNCTYLIVNCIFLKKNNLIYFLNAGCYNFQKLLNFKWFNKFTILVAMLCTYITHTLGRNIWDKI